MEQARRSRFWKEIALEVLLEHDPERSLALCIELNDALDRRFEERQPVPLTLTAR